MSLAKKRASVIVSSKQKKNDIPPLEGGTYMATCIGAAYIGEQYVKYDNQKTGDYKDQCIYVFEIANEYVEVEGVSKPRWLTTNTLTLSLHERSSLRKMVTTWLGKALTPEEIQTFDIMDMVGKPAMLSVTVFVKENGEKRNRIETVSGLPKGVPEPKPESEIMTFSADDPDEEELELFPKWVKDAYRKSTQFADNAPEEKLEIPPEETEGACPI